MTSFRTQLEMEWSWRLDELNLLGNASSGMDSGRREIFNRSRVVILYAHLEGFVKFAFIAYIDFINSVSLVRNEASSAIAAATLCEIFQQLRNPTENTPLFKQGLPKDSKLNIFAREIHFVEQLADFWDQAVGIPISLVETESNLKPAVVRKLLFRVGLPHDLLGGIESDLDRLLQYRNSIAHGSRRRGVSDKDFDALEKATFSLTQTIMSELTAAVQNRAFAKSA